jgi:dihydropteroate synthase
VLDPGLGFGKTVEQNLELIRRTPEIADLGYPILSGLSRKIFVGRLHLQRDSTPEERLPGTLALSRQHLARGASILRVHDVPEHVALLRELEPPPKG